MKRLREIGRSEIMVFDFFVSGRSPLAQTKVIAADRLGGVIGVVHSAACVQSAHLTTVTAVTTR